MHYKILLVIIAFIVGGFFYFHNINPTEVEFFLKKDLSYTVPATYLVIGGFFIGLVLTVLNTIIADMRRAVKDMGIRKGRKAELAVITNYNCGVTALARGENEKAKSYFTKALESNPAGFDTYLRLSDTLLAQGDYPGALGVLEKGYVKNPESLEILARIVDTALGAGDTVRVKMALSDMLKLHPANPGALSSMRELSITLKDWTGAVENQKRLMATMKGKKTATSALKAEQARLRGLLYEQALCETEAGEFAQALTRIKEILKGDDKFVPAYILQGEIQLKQDAPQAAVRLLERGFEKTRDPILLLKLEDLYLESSQPEKALGLYRDALETMARDIDINILLGRLYLKLEMVDDAIAEFERIQNDIEDSYFVELLLAVAYLRRSQPDKSARLFKKALAALEIPAPSFVCTSCGHGAVQWASKCPVCSEWNRLKISRSMAVKRDTPPEKHTNVNNLSALG